MAREPKNITDMEGMELMATFIGAWVKYGVMMMFVIFSSIAHVMQRIKGRKKYE